VISQRLLPLLFACACALAGCSSYDPAALSEGAEFQALSQQWAGERAHPGSILLAPINQPSLGAPDPEDLRGPMQVQVSDLEEALVRSLELVLAEGQRVERTPVGKSAEDYALKEGFDAILYVDVQRWNALFVENTGWWYPNALFLGWYFWPFGAWTIADEVYGIDCALELTLRDAASGRLIKPLEKRLLELVSGPELSRKPTAEEVAHLPRIVLSDGERGLDFFGTWAPGSLDPDQWAEVSLLLEPYALRHASVRVAAIVAKTLRDDLSQGSRDERYATAHAVVVGINQYGDEPCEGARKDGEAIRDLLQGVAPVTSENSAEPYAWLPERNLEAFWGAQASVADVTSALRGAAKRARQEDSLVFYFAGRGQAGAGEGLAGLELLCADGALSLSDIAEALEDSPARRRLIFFDCDFKGGGARGVGAAPALSAAEVRQALPELLLSGSRGAGLVLLASDPSASEEHAQSYAFEAGEERGLLTTFLLRALAGEADTGGDGLSAEDVAGYVVDRVKNLSEVATEARQHPLVVTQDATAVIRPGGR
jgi:hypothetical protein